MIFPSRNWDLSVLNDTLCLKGLEFSVRHTDLPQHLIRILTMQRRLRANCSLRLAELDGGPYLMVSGRPLTGCTHTHPEA